MTSSSRFLLSRCAEGACLARALAVAVSLAAGGCRCFDYDREGAVSPAVAECRRCSHLAIAALERGSLEEAEKLAAAAVKSSPQDVAARRTLAEALLRQNKAAAALEQVRVAGALAPHDCQVLAQLGQIHLALDHWEAAQEAAEKAIDCDPKSAAAWLLRGDSFRRAGKSELALADYARALGLRPGDPEICRRLALVSLDRGQPERALAYSQSHLESFAPGDATVEAYDLHGEILARLGRWDDAAAFMAEAVALGPTVQRQGRLAHARGLARLGNGAPGL